MGFSYAIFLKLIYCLLGCIQGSFSVEFPKREYFLVDLHGLMSKCLKCQMKVLRTEPKQPGRVGFKTWRHCNRQWITWPRSACAPCPNESKWWLNLTKSFKRFWMVIFRISHTAGISLLHGTYAVVESNTCSTAKGCACSRASVDVSSIQDLKQAYNSKTKRVPKDISHPCLFQLLLLYLESKYRILGSNIDFKMFCYLLLFPLDNGQWVIKWWTRKAKALACLY